MGPILVEIIGRVVCCAGSLPLFALCFSQPPRDIRSGSGISAGWGWLVKGCIPG